MCLIALADAKHPVGGGGCRDVGLVVLMTVPAAGASMALRRRGSPGILAALAIAQVESPRDTLIAAEPVDRLLVKLTVSIDRTASWLSGLRPFVFRSQNRP